MRRARGRGRRGPGLLGSCPATVTDRPALWIASGRPVAHGEATSTGPRIVETEWAHGGGHRLERGGVQGALPVRRRVTRGEQELVALLRSRIERRFRPG